MNRTVALSVVAVLLASLFSGLVVAQTTQTGDAAASPDAPGAQFAGVVSVQAAEVDTAVEVRTFEARLSNATTDEQRARIIAEQHAKNRKELDELRHHTDTLREKRRSGNFSEGEYRARMASVTAEINAVETLSNRSGSAASDLPQDTRERANVDVDEIRDVESDAENLSAASNATGPQNGGGLRAPGPPENVTRGPAERGNDADPGSETDPTDEFPVTAADPRNSPEDRDGNATDVGPPSDAANATPGNRSNRSDGFPGNRSNRSDGFPDIDTQNGTESDGPSENGTGDGEGNASNGTVAGDGLANETTASSGADRPDGNGTDVYGEETGRPDEANSPNETDPRDESNRRNRTDTPERTLTTDERTEPNGSPSGGLTLTPDAAETPIDATAVEGSGVDAANGSERRTTETNDNGSNDNGPNGTARGADRS